MNFDEMQPNEDGKDSIGKDEMRSVVRTMASYSKWLFLLAVIGTGVISAMLFLYGFVFCLFEAFESLVHFSPDVEILKKYLSGAIQIIDIFMVGTVFYLISLGLYELFIAKAPLPGWVHIRTLEDLKEKLLGLVVLALVVSFLGMITDMNAQSRILEAGAAIGIIIISIAAYQWSHH